MDLSPKKQQLAPLVPRRASLPATPVTKPCQIDSVGRPLAYSSLVYLCFLLAYSILENGIRVADPLARKGVAMKKARKPRPVFFLARLFAASALLSSPALAQRVVGGVTPAQRPVDAPRISEVKRDQAWFRRALAGVSKPYPPSLLFLERQGDWYTPFTRPGMPGPYDLRRWFSAPH